MAVVATDVAAPLLEPGKTSRLQKDGWRSAEHEIPDTKAGWIQGGPPRLGAQTLRLFREWSGISGVDVATHVEEIRDRAFKVFPWPCISNYLFLEGVVRDSPYYADVLQQLKTFSDTNILDLGCCFGYDVRVLLSDGAPMSQVYAFDLVPEWFTLGYELFSDRDRVDSSHLLIGDFADADSDASPLSVINGQVDIIHASSFFHCFDLPMQKNFARICLQTVLRRKPGAIIYGKQIGMRNPRTLSWNDRPGNIKFTTKMWVDFWHEIGAEVGVKLRCECTAEKSSLFPGDVDGSDDMIWMRYGVFVE